MQRKKKSKKKSSPQLLSGPEEALVTSLIQDFRNTNPAEIVARIPGPRFAQILVERLPLDDESPIPLLLALIDNFKDKYVHKEIKRALFKLKKRGVPVEEFYAEKISRPIIIKAPQKENPAAYLGPVDTTGSRAVIIALYRSPKGVDVGLGLVSDELGFQQFLFGNFSKKRAKEMKDYLSQDAGPMVETSLSHAFTLLENAYRCHLEVSTENPRDYLEVRPWLLENYTLFDRPVIYDFLPQESVSDVILTDSQLEKLFQHKLMESWLIEFESLKPFMEDILKLEDSPIVLTDVQKSDRARQIKGKCVEELFPAPKRELLKHRFEEMAYVFFKLDQEEYSRLSLAAALCMDKEDTTLKMNPVFDFLFEHSFSFYMDTVVEATQDKSQEEDASSSIILP